MGYLLRLEFGADDPMDLESQNVLYTTGDLKLAEANGLVPLFPNQVALIESGRKLTSPRTLDLMIDGVAQKFETYYEKHQFVQPVGKMFVPKESKILNIQTAQSKVDEKIDPEVAETLDKQDSVPVIITLTDDIYKQGQSQEDLRQKRSEFEKNKSEIEDLMVEKKLFRKDAKNGEVKEDLPIANSVSANINKKALEELKTSQIVKKVEFDTPVQAQLDTSLSEINADEIESILDKDSLPLTGKGIMIAIIDTGVNYTHPDLGGCLGSGCKVIGGYDFVNRDSDPMDDHGHGTHVAATAAGNGLLRGVAPDAKVVAYKVLNVSGSGSMSNVILGIQRAADPNNDGDTSDHVDIASMSLGGSGNADDAQSLAVDKATELGVVFTISAGNNGPESQTISSPGTARSAITVAAACKKNEIGVNTRCAGPIADFSSRGPASINGIDLKKPDISAPGVNICAARNGSYGSGRKMCVDNQHIRLNGTSMAAPHVAGVAALMLQANPTLTPTQVKESMKSTARDLGVSYNLQGAGMINVEAAINSSNEIESDLKVWNINSASSERMVVVNQDFALTSTIGQSPNQVVPIPKFNTPGATLNLDKSVLNLVNGQIEKFTATLSIDSDIVAAGFYHGEIELQVGGIRKGIIPINLKINPSLELSTIDDIDYGVFLPELVSWTSDNKPITIKNNRRDIAQTISLQATGFPSGLGLTPASQITIQPGETATINSLLSYQGQLSNGIYSGDIQIQQGSNVIHSIKSFFIKYYPVDITTNSSSINEAVMLKVSDRNDKTFLYYANGLKAFSILLDKPGVYDFKLQYNKFDAITSGDSYVPDANVFREKVNVGGRTQLAFDPSEAINKIEFKPTDETGGVPDLNTHLVFEHFSPKQELATLSVSYSPLHGYKSFYSNVSTDYHYQFFLSSFNPSEKYYSFYGKSSGISSSLTFSNLPSDLKKFEFINNSSKIGQIESPMFMLGRKNDGAYTLLSSFAFGEPIPLAKKQLLYTNISNSEMYLQQILTHNEFFIDRSAWLAPANNARMIPYHFNVASGNPADIDPLAGYTVYNATLPPVWAGRINKAVNGVSHYFQLEPNWKGGQGQPYLFLGQDQSLISYGESAYKFRIGSTIVSQGTVPSYDFSWKDAKLPSYPYSSEAPVEFAIDSFNYTVGSKLLTAKVSTLFNPGKSDYCPPTFRRIDYTVENMKEQRYVVGKTNQVEFELDPCVGTLTDVTLAYSTNNVNYQNLSLADTNGKYLATMPTLISGTVLTIKIYAKDDSGNTLTYSFQLPALEVDTHAPTGSISIENGKEATSRSEVTIAIEGSDNGTGLYLMRFSNDNQKWSEWELFSPSKKWNLFGSQYNGSEGVKTVYVQLQDKEGNISNPIEKSVIVDYTNPIVTMSGDTLRGYPNGKIQSNVDAIDNVSGIGNCVWEKIEGPGEAKFDNPTSPNSNISVSKPGFYRISLKVFDKAGNSASGQMLLIVQKSADIDYNEVVNEMDFTLLLFNWGKPKNKMADLNGDGVVNNDDFTILLFWYKR